MKRQISVFLSILTLSIICLFSVTANAQDETAATIIDTENTVASTYFKEYTYVGKELTPAVTVVTDGKKLKKDVDYTVKYSDNINVGSGKATITGIGSYTGTFVKEFPIVPVTSADSLSFSMSSMVSYTGKQLKPGVTIKYRNMTLAVNKDYTVTYSSNTNVGNAKAVIKGIGNYSFTKTMSFKIVPPTVSGLKFSPTVNSITLKWNKVSNVTGYQILIYDSDKKVYKSVKYLSASTTSYTIKGLEPSTLYKYRVRGYKKIGNETYYGFSSKDLLTRTRSANTDFTSVSQNGSSISLSWRTVRGSGYVIRYATKSNFSNAKEIFINDSRTSSYTIRNINKYATYYVQISSYTTLNTTKYYGTRSQPISTALSKRIAYYSSNYVNNPNRTTNMRLAAEAIDGTIVMPGETFSFNKTVGQRTYSKGYKDAPVFTGGNNVENGVGGGICQVASTMFNTALYANMGIVERSQHSQRVTYVPLGRDAAISWGSQDFRFKNTTQYPVKIRISVANGVCECELYSNANATIPSVSLPVSRSGNTFTLNRYVSGRCNYTTRSRY